MREEVHSELILFGPATGSLRFVDPCRYPSSLRAGPGCEINSRPWHLMTRGGRLYQNRIAKDNWRYLLAPRLVLISSLIFLKVYDLYKL